MSTDYMRYLAAFHTMLGRCQASRRAGQRRRAFIQFMAAERLFAKLLKLPL